MDNWRSSTWGGEIRLEYGKGIRDYSDVAGLYRVFGSNGPVGWTSKALAPGPGVILGRKGAYRGVRFSADPFFVIDTAYYVVPKTNLDMRWLYYAIVHHKLGEIDDGSPIPSTTRTAVYVRHVDVPPIEEQRAISSILGTLDDKIDLNRSMNETLEATARAIFRDWFIDFGPTRAKMEGRAPYLAPEIWTLFPDRMESGQTPVGWKIGCLDDLLILQRGFDLPNHKRTPGPYVVLAASGPNGFHDQFMVRGPGVTTGRSGVLGKVFFTHKEFWPLNTSLWVKEFKVSTPTYAYFLLQHLDLASFNAGFAVPTLNRNHVHKCRLPVPSKSVVTAWDRIVMPMFLHQRMNELESDTLAATRGLLLPKLMSGEIHAKDAEKAAEAAL